jgi:hypothetical protein
MAVRPAAVVAASMRAWSFAASHEKERKPGAHGWSPSIATTPPWRRAASGKDWRYAFAFEQRPGRKTVVGGEEGSREGTREAGRSWGMGRGRTRAGGGGGGGGGEGSGTGTGTGTGREGGEEPRGGSAAWAVVHAARRRKRGARMRGRRGEGMECDEGARRLRKSVRGLRRARVIGRGKNRGIVRCLERGRC